jgi:hypothetical protein
MLGQASGESAVSRRIDIHETGPYLIDTTNREADYQPGKRLIL